ncbi:hypothetical protein IW140_006169 [Coemansia sp. RSA 1813]|nr:hypothetical protein EV178_006184 [Coemansia sp. RSA 1646]KAJ1766553.1 hypothetical protein LPJ74_005822 [Coemansia sp. RSA 1843]KAJ2090972.1 hypothetical protein IW138_002166 [Coemansia sp. RSA 986]KAJ2215127.1 hypothetical protein EV179_002495 [Coemansia sp. RSA 487]KAJ2563297.1 hypothetical protein IW140_006169 [Coemansia sp. RSA 1813]
MDGSSPAAAAIIERVISFLGKKELIACKTLNKTWLALTTSQSARNIDCHITQLPLRIAYYRRKGLLTTVRSLTVDLGYIDGYLSAPAYERRINNAAMLLGGLPATIRHLKLHMPDARTILSNSEIYFGSMALCQLLSALSRLITLDLSDCPVSLLDTPASSQLGNIMGLKTIRWFSLGRNDMSSAATLYHLVSANSQSLTALYGKSDIADKTLQALCTAPNLRCLDASGSSISDDALLELVETRGSKLRELVLSDCTSLTRRSISHLVPKALPQLASLDLYNVMVTTDTYQGLFNEQAHWPYLRDLKLKAAIPHTSPRHDSLVNDDILEAIGQNCPRLVSLRLFGCHGITDNGLSSILGNLGYLRELVVMHSASEPTPATRDNTASATVSATRSPRQPLSADNSTSDNDFWADIPSLPRNALSQQQPLQTRHRSLVSPPSTAPSSPRVPDGDAPRTENGQRIFTSHALHRGVRSRRFNLLNLDMEYDSVCAEHLAKLSHLHILCGRMITRHAKSLIENQFPKCKMMVWNID